MATYKKFYNNKVSVKLFFNAGEQDEDVIYIEPIKDIDKEDLRDFKEKIETLLTVDSSEFTRSHGKPAFSIKLEPGADTSLAEEVLRNMFHGGEEESDAMGLNKGPDPEEKQEEGDVDIPDQQPAPAQALDQNADKIPKEGISVVDGILKLYESTYRTAKYWDTLSKAAGKNKHRLTDKDVLRLRKDYTKKPDGKRRNEVLQALDSAMRYFVRRIKKDSTPEAAAEFKDKYRSIGGLAPSDYKTDKPESNSFEGGETEDQPGQEEVAADALKVADLFTPDTDEQDAYADFEKN